MLRYKVRANISGQKRSTTRITFKTKKEAQDYADETNKYRKGANARVVVVK